MNNLIKRNVFNLFDDCLFPTSVFNSAFSELFNDNEWMRPSVWAAKVKTAYPMNIVNIKKDNAIVATRLEYALAGFLPEEIKVTRSGNTIKVVAEHVPEENMDESVEYNGISYKKFETQYHIPEKANKEEISKTFKNGLLSITIPIKSEKKETSDEIEI